MDDYNAYQYQYHYFNDSYNSQNGSWGDYYNFDEASSFFGTYYSTPRFVTETLLAALSLISNAIAVVVLRYVHGSWTHTVYHILFINLATANMLASALSWIANNTLFLFKDKITDMLLNLHSICDLYLILLAAACFQSSFGITSTLTMLGFTTVQYYAVCRPMQHMAFISKSRVCLHMTVTWVVSIVTALVPLNVAIIISQKNTCDQESQARIVQIVVIGANISMGIVSLAYLLIVMTCVRIYCEIHKLQARLSKFRFDQSVRGERKAFYTIVILVVTLSIFYIPYNLIHLITLNTHQIDAMDSNVMIYYMNILPYLKFCTDPLIYGMRMREVRDGFRRATVLMPGLRKCVGDGHQPELLTPSVAPSTNSVNIHQITSI